MSRTPFVLAAMALVVLSSGCSKLKAKLGKDGASAEGETAVTVPPPRTTATTPPIWHAPDPPAAPASTTTAASTASTTAAPLPASPELVKARAAADAKDFKRVRALLEKKVRTGKPEAEEILLVHRACVAVKDAACAAALKARHPDEVVESP